MTNAGRTSVRPTAAYVLGLLFLAGCNWTPPPPQFVFSEKTKGLVKVANNAVETAIVDNFGTPNTLVAWQKLPFDYGAAGEAPAVQPLQAAGYKSESPYRTDTAPRALVQREAGWRLLEGRNLYMVHCLHCHGVSGDGDGPTAKFLNPRPRDYRPGVFKFTSTLTGLKPRRDDLKTTIASGVPGTTMPAFVLLGDESLELLVDYVRWLSARGEFESRLVNEMTALDASEAAIRQRVAEGQKAKEGGETHESIIKELTETLNEEFAGMVDTVISDIAEAWAKAEEPESQIIPKTKRPPATRKSMDHGRELFLSKTAKCADCHGAAGVGNGSLTEDFWDIPNTKGPQKYPRPGLHDQWGFHQLPRNLTRGVYRGGRRPVDLYRRVFAGIKGTQMPGFGASLKEEDIWDIVNYVMSLPFEGKVSAQPSESLQATSPEKVAAAH